MSGSPSEFPEDEPRLWHSIVSGLVLTVLMFMRCQAYFTAGGLWRDEIHSVDMATLPSSDLFFALTNDSFPIGWQLVLRGWISVLGSNDSSVRLLGFLLGLAVIPAMVWMARQFSSASPWWLLLFLGLDPSMVVFGGEVRAYGLGIIALLILIGTSWRQLQHTTAAGWCGLIVAALLAVQTSYTNCFLLAATFIACGIVALRRGSWSVCLGFGLTGLLSAASMLPYALYVFPRLSTSIKSFFGDVDWKVPIGVTLQVFQRGGIAHATACIIIGLVAFTEILRRVCATRKANTDEGLHRDPKSNLDTLQDRDLALFLAVFFWLGTIGFWGYIFLLGVPTQLWYHLPWVALLAVTTELGMVLWLRRNPSRKNVLVGIAALSCLLILFEVTPRVRHRFTTIDMIAHDLKQTVSPRDLVVVIPWYFGITVGRYYHGPAEWIRLPNVDQDGKHCGYAELKQGAMLLPTPIGIREELERVEAVLNSGGKVWLMTPFLPLEPGATPTILTGAPDPEQGWKEFAYNNSWQQLMIARMESMGATRNFQRAPLPGEFNPHENPYLYVFERSNRN